MMRRNTGPIRRPAVTTGSFRAVGPATRGSRTRRPPVRKKRNRRTTQRLEAPATSGSARHVVSALFGITFLVGCGVGVHYGWRALKQSGRLAVGALEVRGQSRVSRADVEAYTGVRPGDAILDIDLDGAALALRRHPWIRGASVRRRLPDQLLIEVEEQEPKILVSLDEVYIANAQGQLFKRLGPSDGLTMVVLTGLERSTAERDPLATERVIRDAIALSDVFAESPLGRLEELNWDADLGWTVVTRRARSGDVFETHLGLDPVPHLDIAVRALRRLDELGRAPLEVWADGTRNPNRVHVRLSQVRKQKGETSHLFAKAGE